MVLFILSCYAMFFAAIPPFMLNDEPDHFQYVYWLDKGIYPKMPLKSGVFAFDKQISNVYDIIEVASNDYNIPSFGKIKKAVSRNAPFLTNRKEPPLTYQVHHPPLYYLSALLFFKPASMIFKGIIPVYYATRLASTLFYFLTVCMAYLIALKVLKKPRTAYFLTGVFAVNPVVLKMGVAVNPDIASAFFSLLLLYLFLKFVALKQFGMKTVFVTSLVLAISALVKFQNIVMPGLALVFFTLKGFWEGNVKKYAGRAMAVTILTLLFISPWIIHSLLTYQSITPSYRAYTFFCTANLSAIPWYLLPFETVFELRHAFFHFAGFLGWGEPYPFKIFFLAYAATFVLLIAGGVYSVLRSREKPFIVTGLFAMFIVLFFLGVSFTYKLNRYSCDIQGRYLLSALFPFILFAYRGGQQLLKSQGEKIAYWLFLFTVWQFYFILFFVLIPRYYV